MSPKIVREALRITWKMLFQNRLRRSPSRARPPAPVTAYTPRPKFVKGSAEIECPQASWLPTPAGWQESFL